MSGGWPKVLSNLKTLLETGESLPPIQGRRSKSQFNYVTYIRTTPEKLWEALIKPEFTKIYWAGTYQKSDWTKGSRWEVFTPDGRLWDRR